MPFDASRYGDIHGELSPDLFGDTDLQFQARLQGYYTQAEAKTQNWGSFARIEEAKDEWVYVLAYRRLYTKMTGTPANQSQPEYSRQVISEQIKAIRESLVGHERKFSALQQEAEIAADTDLDDGASDSSLLIRG
jgi:hypothetical protein